MSSESRTETAVPVSPGLPMFYRKPEALAVKRHQDLRIRQSENFAFARQTNAVAVTTAEFAAIARNFPIVFSGPNHYPVAVLGLETENIFVRADGRWAEGAYIPAYLRRYPFVFIGLDDRQFALGVDLACENLTETESEDSTPLFVDGKSSRITDEALRFCIAFQTDHEVTLAFTAALAEQKLLVEAQYGAPVIVGKYLSLKGFHVVDTARLRALPDAVVADWHRKGYLALIYAHLASQLCWGDLAFRSGIS